MKLQILLFTLTAILSALCFSVVSQEVQQRQGSDLNSLEETYWMIHGYIEEIECSVRRSLVRIHNLIFAEIYPLVDTPGRPENIQVSDIGSTWVYLQWEAPPIMSNSESMLFRYDIIVTNSRNGTGRVVPYSPMTFNMSAFNVTDLQHETSYVFSVMALSENCGTFAKSQASTMVYSTTKPLDRVETHPSSGSLIAGFKDQQGLAVLTCNSFSDNQQVNTVWSIGNTASKEVHQLSQSSASLFLTNQHYNNELTIQALNSELDDVVVYCGTNENPKLANFRLKIYRSPCLKTDVVIKVLEYTSTVSVDLNLSDHVPFPEPSYFVLKREEPLLSTHKESNVKISSSTVYFQNISRSNSGNYSMTVTNFAHVIDAESKEFGSFTSRFKVDVIYGPEILPGVEKHYVLLGDRVSLICGYNLDSNPPAVVTWTNPDKNIVSNTDTYVIDDGPHVVQLNITNASERDSGAWICNVSVIDKCVHRVVDGVFEEDCTAIIHHKSFITQLIVVVRPKQPFNLIITDCGLTCIQLRWEHLAGKGTSKVSHFEITCIEASGTGATHSVGGHMNSYNFTELIPGKAYRFSVVAVTVAGHVVARSQSSTPVHFPGFDVTMKSMPSSGILIAKHEGAENAITLNCSILSINKTVHIQWSVQNFKNNSKIQVISNETAPDLFNIKERVETASRNFFTQSYFTVQNISSELDGVIVYCDTNEEPAEVADFTLRVYYPSFIRNFSVTYKSGDQNVTVDIGFSPILVTNPSKTIIEKNGLNIPGAGNITLINGSALFFEEISRDSAGTYCYMITCYDHDNHSIEIGTYKSCITLNVIYGPELVPGPEEFYILLAHPISLVCGYNLQSNPPAAITWTDPSGNTVDSTHANINGPDVVEYHIEKAGESVNGTWKCILEHEHGKKIFTMNLFVVVPPGPPDGVAVEEYGISWLVLQWSNPQVIGNPPFSDFEVTGLHNNGGNSFISTVEPTSGSKNSFSITNLEPEGSYEFSVVAVVKAGDIITRSLPSNRVQFSAFSGSTSALYRVDLAGKQPKQACQHCPKLRNLDVKLLETSQSVSFDLSADLSDYALSNLVSLSRSYQQSVLIINEEDITVTNATLLFPRIGRDYTGIYNLSLEQNCVLDNTMTESGSLTLNVLYGPEMQQGIKQSFSILNSSVSLICGYQLQSNPVAEITWIDPEGNTVRNSDRITMENGNNVIKLTISHTRLSDSGKWTCNVTVTDTCIHRIVEGKPEQYCDSEILIGHLQHDVELLVIDPPSEPLLLRIADFSVNCIELIWEHPDKSGSPSLSYYEVSHVSDNGTGATDKTRENRFEFTDLSHGTGYRFSVVAVSIAGDVVGRSPQSNILAFPGFDDSIIVNTEPPSGSQLVGLDGTSNFITLNCSVYHGNDKEIVWSVQNFRSWATVKRVNYDVAPGLFYVSKETNQSHFTIQNLTSEFDGVTVFCGTEEEHKLANFTFKLYRSPVMKHSEIYTVKENQHNVVIDLSLPHTPFPNPHIVSLQKQDSNLHRGDGVTISPYSVVFHIVNRRHAGNYSVYLANRYLDDHYDYFRDDTANFTLNVQYGPDFLPTSLEHHSVEQCPVSLVCGYNLGSEPLASVTWTDPQGNVVTNSDLYAIDNGPSVVRLNITSTNKIHNGTWKCNITVTYADGSVNETVIDIPLVVHAPSSEPRNLSVDKEGSSSLTFRWNEPVHSGNPHFSYYELELDGKSFSLNNKTNFYVVTGYSQFSSFVLTLRAVSSINDIVLKSTQVKAKVYIFGNTITMDSSTFPEKLQCSVLSHHWISNEHEQNSVPSRENNSPCLKHQVASIKEKAQNEILHFKCKLAEFTNVTLTFFGKALINTEPPKLVNFTALEFSEVTREHSGTYVLRSTFCYLDNCDAHNQEIELDVHYGPEIHKGSNEQFVLLGESVSLICGFNLDSNPLSTVIWTDPENRQILESHSRYTLDDGPEVVLLNISETMEADTGMWQCSVKYEDQNVVTFNITLKVLVPASQPSDVTIVETDPDCVRITWSSPRIISPSLSYYEVSYISDDGFGLTTPANGTSAKICGLNYVNTYTFQVVAVSVAGGIIGRSVPSCPVLFSAPKQHNRIEPDSGSLFAAFEGSVNATTFTCNLFDSSGYKQHPTFWMLTNLQGSTDLQPVSSSAVSNRFYIHNHTNIHQNNLIDHRMMVLNLTADLDGVIVFCGSIDEPKLANFTLKIYRPPNLKKNLKYTIVENKTDLRVNLSPDTAPFPPPSFHVWKKSDAYVTLENTGIYFDRVTRNHTGVYSLTVVNYDVHNKTNRIGMDTGNFTLDVVYGPEMIKNDEDSYVLEGHPVLLICGYNLNSNPGARVIWTNPNGEQVANGNDYVIDEDLLVVQLNITKTKRKDNGTWKCKVMNNANNFYSKTLEVDLRLTVVGPASKPNDLSIMDMGSKCVKLCWNAPTDEGHPRFSYYEVRSISSDGKGNVYQIPSSENVFNYTIPEVGASYEFTVAAVSVAGNIIGRSTQSDPVQLSGFVATVSINPRSGSVLADFEGAVNFTTLSCIITSGDMNRTIVWNVNYKQENNHQQLTEIHNEVFFIHGGILNTKLTILTLSSNLDGVLVYCGTEDEPLIANFTLRIYRPPQLNTNYVAKFSENSQNVVIDLGLSPSTFPMPTRITLERNRESKSTFQIPTKHIALINGSHLFFEKITRNDAGNYSLTVVNYHLVNTLREVGIATSNFTIDVIYGPELIPASMEYYVLLNESTSLTCGYNLDSNPPARVSWIDPHGNQVIPSQMYVLDHGPKVVRLNITNASTNDTGMWQCNCSLMIDNAEFKLTNVTLTVVEPPPKPEEIKVSSSGSTWVQIQWKIPLVFRSRYEITFVDHNGVGKTVVTEKNATRINVTNLVPGSIYEFTVVNVYRVGSVISKSEPSQPVQCNTTRLDFIKTEPSSGMLITDYKGKEIHLKCTHFRDGHKYPCHWTVGDYQPSVHHSYSYVLNLTSDLDGKMVYCGTNEKTKLANFTLRIYRPPRLIEDIKIKTILGTENVSVDLNTYLKAFPPPSLVKIEKKGKSVSNKNAVTTTNAFTVIFHKIVKEHAGTYTITATNYHLWNKTEHVGSAVANLTLDVLYGPVMTVGPVQHYVMLGDPISLICGYNLDSKPPAFIDWRDPNGNKVENDSNYCLDNGPEVVQLKISRVTKLNEGNWTCNIQVQESNVYGTSNSSTFTKNMSHTIQLTVLENYDTQINVSMVENGYTWVYLNWTNMCSVFSDILHYEIIQILHSNETGRIWPVCNNTWFNITDLHPEKTYDFSVTAVSERGGIILRSLPSDFITFEPFPWKDLGIISLLTFVTISVVTVFVNRTRAIFLKQRRTNISKSIQQKRIKLATSDPSKEQKRPRKEFNKLHQIKSKKVPGKPIGKPKISSITTNSMTLSWGEPESDPQLVTGYTILYCTANKQANAQWSQYQVVGKICTAEVKGLKSKVRYIFKVRPLSDDGCGPDSDASVATETKQSVAIYVKSNSQVIDNQSPKILKPHIGRRKRTKGGRSKISHCDIIAMSKPVGRPNEKVLLLIGETGSGKSTLINGIANYILGVCWQDDFRFRIVDEGGKSQVYSQTSEITAYSFHGTELPYTLTVIDTPGFGDTSGIERDKATVNQIKELFSNRGPNSIDQLHGVGFVTQATNSRLTPTQKYIFDSVVSIFGKDIASNIFLLMTFADGQQPPVLSAIKEATIPYKRGFQFNNSALYANQNEDHGRFSEMFWNLGKKNFHLFFTEFEKAEACSLQLTRETLNERQRLETLVEGLKLQIRAGLSKIDMLRQKQRILRKRETEILQNQHFTYELTVTKQRKIDVPSSVFVTNCLQCNFTCHYPCPIAGNVEKYRCKAMDGRGPHSANCTVCPGNCHWSQHTNASFRYELYYEVEVQTSDDLKKNLSDALEGKSQIEATINDIERELDMLQRAIVGMVKEAKQSLERLQEIALKPNPLTEIEYIDLLIMAEKHEKSPGFTERIKAFEVIKTIVLEQGVVGGEKKIESSWWQKVLEN